MKALSAGLVAFLATLNLSVISVLGASPSIIPLPVTLQTRPGTFTLAPAQSIPGALGQAPLQILSDAPSFANAQYLAAQLLRPTGFQFKLGTNSSGALVKNAILLTTVGANANLGAEGYELWVYPDSVLIRAPGQAGLFYGIQSLLQLLPPQIYSPAPVTSVAWTAPCVYVYDVPSFSWRGWMLDVARHFLTKDDARRFIDIMAMHKLNTLHMHLTDDQGWRVQSLLYPNLNSTGSWRTNMDYGLNPRSNSNTNAAGQYGGFYTQNDIRALVSYAQERHITIVPEIELPCHATAALASYPQYGCGNPVADYNMDAICYTGSLYGYDLFSLAGPGCWTFFTNMLTEVMGLFPSTYIHCGGDEVIASGDTQWTSYSNDANQMSALGISPSGGSSSIKAYQYWFSTNLAAFFKANGRTMMGWTEIDTVGIVSNSVLMDWINPGQGSLALTAAEAKQYVVVAWETNCYMNYYMATNGLLSGTDVVPDEPYFAVGTSAACAPLSVVYSLNPIPAGLPAQYDSYILGAEGTQFSEYIPGLRNVEFKALPRMCAMSEVLWTPATIKTNYTDFTSRLSVQESRFNNMGVTYDRTNQNVITVGSWSSAPKSPSTTNVSFNITPYVTSAGELDVQFCWNGTASDGTYIYSVALLVNGVQVDSQTMPPAAGKGSTYAGFAGAPSGYPEVGTTYVNLPFFILHLPSYVPGATYTIQATIAGAGGTAAGGNISLVNYN